MSVIQFSAKDRLRSTVVQPSNYLVQINSVSEAMAKDGKSKNFIIDDAEIIRDADSGSTQFAGVPLPFWTFNSKRPDFMIPFFEALGVTIGDDTKLEWNAVSGKKIVVFIGNGEYDGRMQNQVKGTYRAAPAE